MSAAVAVLRRELVDKRRAILFALGFGLIPLIAPIISALATGSRSGGAELRDLLAIWLASAFFMTAAFLGGVTTIGRDLVEGRLSFYLARPISASALWFGKIAAVVLYALFFGLAAALPATLIGGGLLSLTKLGNAGIQSVFGLTLISVPFIVVLAHALGISIRSKSAWLALDVLLLGMTGFFVWTYLRVVLVTTSGPTLGLTLLAALGIILAVSLAAAGLAQVTWGRTDIRAGHRAMSLTLWTPVVIFLIVAAAYLAWMARGTAADLDRVMVQEVSPRGDWATVAGPRHFGLGYSSAFLFNPATGESLPLGNLNQTTFSGDGTTAVVLRPSLGATNSLAGMVEVARLDRRPLRLVPTEIVFDGYPPTIGVSHDGGRIATFNGRQISILDLKSGRSVMSANVAGPGVWRGVRFLFLNGDVVRCYALGAGAGSVPLYIFEVNTTTRKARQLGIAQLPSGGDFRVSPDGGLIVGGATLFDGVTGAPLRTLGEAARANSEFLSDGRIAVARAGAPQSKVEIFDRSGTHVRTIALPATGSLRTCAEPAAGKLTLQPWTNEAWVVGVDDGSFRRLATGGLVAASGRRNQSSDASGRLAPGSVATRLVTRSDGSLVEIDPERGGVRVILTGRVSTRSGS